jgi:hypothetical protein
MIDPQIEDDLEELTVSEESLSLHQQFHKHLKSCEACSSRPFSLCPEGERLLAQASLP